MTTTAQKKTIYINKDKRVNSELFDEVRLSKGLSRFQLAIDVELSPQTVRRVLVAGGDPRPSTVKKVGDYLNIPASKWYIKREPIIPNGIPDNNTS
jgi:transcriptional regulator with XRE-family HTH domain